MYNDKIEFLKRKINRTYKWYTGERVDGKASLNDVIELFNLKFPIDRIEDFEITKFDIDNYSIEIKDKKNGTIYKGKYSSYSKLLATDARDLKFVNTTIIYSPDVKVESTGYIGDKDSIIDRITLNEDSNVIEVFMENYRCGVFGKLAKKLLLIYIALK